MTDMTRRGVLGLGAATVLTSILAGRIPVEAAETNTLTIAFNANIPSFDPTVGGSAVNPTVQAVYRSIFDQMVGQKPNLEFEPGLFTAWGWSDDRKSIWLDVREGVTWHDGTPFTPEDVVWSIERAADPKTGSPVQNIWSAMSNLKISGNRVTAETTGYDPTLLKWMAFMTGYVMPKAYYTKVGAEGFEKKPIGTGPYMFDEYQSNAFLRLKANPKYWGPKPPFETVVFKFVTDATSRVAEIESGSSDVTLEIPFEEYDRLRVKPGLAGVAAPVSDIGLIFITNTYPVMQDKNVRLAMAHAIDKQAIVKRVLRGYGVPLDTLLAPEYIAYDPSVKVEYSPEKAKKLLAASGFSPEKPVKFTIQTTRGLKPKDYEMIQAIVGMWRKVGIEADIEVYEVAKHFELRAAHKLAPAAFYNWGNAMGDPIVSIGFAMFSKSPHSAWKSDDIDAKLGPLWGESDEAKRVAAFKDLSRYIAEQGYILPLLQYYQPIVFKSSLKVVSNTTGALQPVFVTKS